MTSLRLRVYLFASLLAFAVGLGCQPSERPPPSVLLVVLDTTRADATELPSQGPLAARTVDRLAREGVRFPNARTNAPWTLPSHASLFTGLHVRRHGAHWEHPVLDAELATLAELLPADYEKVGFSENPHISRKNGFGQGFDLFVKTSRPESTNARVLEWLETRRVERPFFLFVNLMTPHLPYSPPPKLLERFLPAGTAAEVVQGLRRLDDTGAILHNSGAKVQPPGHLEVLRALYQADVAFGDRRIAKLIAAIGDHVSLDRVLIVVTSDHGEMLGEHGLLGHQLSVYETLLRVPLVMRLSGVFDGGTRREAPVQLIDVLPTILDVAGVPIPVDLDGMSLVHGDPPDDRPVVAEYRGGATQRQIYSGEDPNLKSWPFAGYLWSIQIGSLKLIAPDRGDPILYDLASDPDEQVDLSRARPEDLTRLRAALAEWMQAHPSRGQLGPAPELDQAERKELRALGYLP